MNPDTIALFWPFGIFIIILFVIGVYCILATYNLIRALIGLELVIKAVTLLLVLSGYINRHIALTQALVITLIVVEVVLIAIAVGVVLGIYSHNDSLDVRQIRNLKG
jgi:multisubunit Na+/H+ antiporter MnhC subunit